MGKSKKKSKTPLGTLLDLLVYFAVRVVTGGVFLLGIENTYRIAALATALAERLPFRFARRPFHRAREHLRRSFPDWPEERIGRTARASVHNLICMALEILWTPRLIRPDTWRRHVRLVDAADAVRLLTARRGPLVFVTGHLGNWEIAGYTMAAVGLPSYTVARHVDNPYLNDFLFGVRERMGQRMIYKKGAAAKVPAAMDAGEVVCFVADQDAGRKGVFVDFFGRQASTFKSIALMAMRYDCPLLVVGCRRVGTFRFEIHCPRIILPAQWQGRDRPVHWITQEFARAIEQMARDCPEQYFWFHRRWKHRPKGQPRPPGGIA